MSSSSPPPQMPPSGDSPQGYPPYGYAPQGYVPQYGFQSYYDATPEALLAPARQAGWLLVILGAFLLLMGTCVASSVGVAGEKPFADAFAEIQRQQPNNALPITPRELRLGTIGFGIIVGVAGLIGLILGFLVRGGGRGWTVLAIVLSTMPLLFFTLIVLMSVTAGVAAFASNLVCFGIPSLAFIAAIVLLARSLKNAKQIDAARHNALFQQQQYAAYYHQQQQQQRPPETPA